MLAGARTVIEAAREPLRSKFAMLLVWLLAAAVPIEVFAALRESLSLDADWRFHQGDIPFPEIRGHGMSYANAKAGRAWGAAAPQYDELSVRIESSPGSASGFVSAMIDSKGTGN